MGKGRGLRYEFEEDIKDLINDTSLVKISKNEYIAKDDVQNIHNTMYNFQEQVLNRSDDSLIGRFRQKIYQSPFNNTYVAIFEEDIPVKNLHKFKKISNIGSIGELVPFLDYDIANWFSEQSNLTVITTHRTTPSPPLNESTTYSYMSIYGLRNVPIAALRDYMNAFIFDRGLRSQEYCNDTSIIGPNRAAILRAINKRIWENRQKYETFLRNHRRLPFMKYGKGSYNSYTYQRILANSPNYRVAGRRGQQYSDTYRDNLRMVVRDTLESLSDAYNLRRALKNELGTNVNYTYEGQLDGIQNALDNRDTFYKVIKRLSKTTEATEETTFDDCFSTTELTPTATETTETTTVETTTELTSEETVTKRCHRKRKSRHRKTTAITIPECSTTRRIVITTTPIITTTTTPLDWNEKMYRLELEKKYFDKLLSQASAMPWYQQISENKQRLYPKNFPCPVRKLYPGEKPINYALPDIPLERYNNEADDNTTDTTVYEATETTTELSENEQRNWMDNQFRNFFLEKYQRPLMEKLNHKHRLLHTRLKRALLYVPIDLPVNPYAGKIPNNFMYLPNNGC